MAISAGSRLVVFGIPKPPRESVEGKSGVLALGQMALGQVLELYQGVLKWSVRDEEYVHDNVNRSKLIETIVSPIVAALRSVFEKMNK